MSVPKLRFKEFDGDWSLSSLNQLSTKIGDGIHATPKYDETGEIPFINGNNLIDGSVVINENTKCISADEFQKYNQILSDRTLFLSINGTIGNLAFYKNEKVLLGKSVCFINLKNDIDKKFIYLLLQSPQLTKTFNSELTGTTIKNLSLATVRNSEFYCPSEEEQTKIASFLSAVDEKISQLTQKHQLLSQYKQGMMQKLFSQQIRFKVDDGSEFGEWEEKNLVDISNIITGTTPETANKSFYNGSYLFVSPVDIQENRYISQTKTTLTESGFRKCRAIPKDSILFVCIGSTIGKVAQNKKICATNQQINAVIPNDEYCADYVYFQLLLQAQSIKLKAGTQAVPIINKTEFGKTTLLMPCLEEQIKIANFLSAIDQKVEVVAQQLEQAKQWKKGLLQQMFV